MSKNSAIAEIKGNTTTTIAATVNDRRRTRFANNFNNKKRN